MSDKTNYQVLARKWRPKTFQALTGQEHVVQALTNALNQNRLHHAYLFTGTRGVGKTTVARIFAKCLNCEIGITANPCGTCNACQEIDTGRFIDLLEIDAASRTRIEDTRELLDNVPYAPTKGRFKIYLIDEVHMLSGHSFNALLKTLEEPPPHIKFLLATTDPQKLPATVLSRCLQFNLKNVSALQIQNYLSQLLNEEHIAYEAETLPLIARAANGSMRDALSLLDQAIAYGNGQLLTTEIHSLLGTFVITQLQALLNALAKKDSGTLFNIIAQLAEQGADFSHVLEEVLALLHQIAVSQVLPENKTYTQDSLNPAPAFSQLFTAEEIQLYYQIGIMGRRDLPFAPSARAGFEMILLRMLAFRPVGLNIGSLMTTTTPTLPTSQAISEKPKKPTKTTAVLDSLTASTEQWPQLLAKLNLEGAAHALASECALIKLEQNEVILRLKPNLANLLTDKQKAYIAQAFTQHLQRPIQITFEIGDAHTASPAALTKRTTAAKHTEAQQAIAQDKHVQALLETFNAKIIEDSINVK
ncbi:MAG: DNA polymerase III subunit gamma/tau [Gammaproteobacteria bacterium]